MPDISKITLPSGNEYNIKDAWARTQIQAITGGSAVVFKGVSSTALTDGGNEDPTVSGSVVATKSVGDLYFYSSQEFIYGPDDKWHSLGQTLSILGDLAYKDSAQGSYTPGGTVSQPTFTGGTDSVTISSSEVSSGANYTPAGTVSGGSLSLNTLSSTGSYTPQGSVGTPSFTGTAATVTTKGTPAGTVSTPTISVNTAGSTSTIKQVSAVNSVVTATTASPAASTTLTGEIVYYDYSNETLTLKKIGTTSGNPISTANATVKTGDASYTSSQPTFTGALLSSTASYTPGGSVSSPTFTGTAATVTVSGTPSGSVSALSWTGQPVKIIGSVTPTGTVSKPTFTGTPATVTVS